MIHLNPPIKYTPKIIQKVPGKTREKVYISWTSWISPSQPVLLPLESAALSVTASAVVSFWLSPLNSTISKAEPRSNEQNADRFLSEHKNHSNSKKCYSTHMTNATFYHFSLIFFSFLFKLLCFFASNQAPASEDNGKNGSKLLEENLHGDKLSEHSQKSTTHTNACIHAENKRNMMPFGCLSRFPFFAEDQSWPKGSR